MPEETGRALSDQIALHGPWTLYVCAQGECAPSSERGLCRCKVQAREGFTRWAERVPVEVVSKDALATAIVGGVEVAGKVRDANQIERRRLEAGLALAEQRIQDSRREADRLRAGVEALKADRDKWKAAYEDVDAIHTIRYAENKKLQAERDTAFSNGWDAARLASIVGWDSSAFEGDMPAWDDLFDRGLAVQGRDNTGEGYLAITKEGVAHLEYAVAAVAPLASDENHQTPKEGNHA